MPRTRGSSYSPWPKPGRSEFERARADLVRAQVAYVTRRGRDAPLLLLNAARRLEPIAPDLARETYVDAMIAAGFAGRFAAPGGAVLDVARAVRAASGHPPTAELIEAAVRSGTSGEATDAYRWLTEMAVASASDWALGLQARSHALLTDGDEAEHFYREAIEHLSRTRMRAELARACLLYGEWLRRQRRPGEAREQLRTALDMLEAMGMEGFAERARRELRATGERRARRRSVSSQSELTVQEAQVAKLAREGLSKPEIGARLYISARTDEVLTALDRGRPAELRAGRGG